MNPIDVTNSKRLANYLRTSTDQLDLLIDNEYIINDYSSGKVLLKLDFTILDIDKFCIPKKNSTLGYRVIYKPKAENLINCLKILSINLNKIYNPPISATGFIKGRGIKCNAEKHLAKKYILSIDLNNFFETITNNMVVEVLKEYGFPNETALNISKIVTVDGKLIQGFHTSPTLANMIFKKLDLIFENLDKNIEYSRYADDLTFSSESEIICLPEITKIIEDFGFKINDKKTKIMKRGQNQYVTGLTVFDDQYPRIAKRIKKKLRLEVYYINKFGLRNHTLKKLNISWQAFFEDQATRRRVESMEGSIHDYIYGWLVFINGIEPEFSEKCFELMRTKKINI